jgi:hypothetical protein
MNRFDRIICHLAWSYADAVRCWQRQVAAAAMPERFSHRASINWHHGLMVGRRLALRMVLRTCDKAERSMAGAEMRRTFRNFNRQSVVL